MILGEYCRNLYVVKMRGVKGWLFCPSDMYSVYDST